MREKSAKWYKEKLGFEIRSPEGHWITVAPKGMPMELHLCEKHYPLEPGNTGFCFMTKNVAKEQKTLEAKVVADSIVADIRGVQANAKYDGKVTCFCDAGYHKGFSMTFDYMHPQTPPPLSIKGWIGKQLVNIAYWNLIPQGRV